MSWLWAGGELLAGVIVLVGLWLVVQFLERRGRDKPLTQMRFAVLPSLLLLWLVGGVVLILRGLGALG
jgi:hypothetical protein